MKIKELTRGETLFGQLYDLLRVVDPVTKEILDLEIYRPSIDPNEDLSFHHYCYEIWGDHGVCENCCSTRAAQEKKVYMKTESAGKEVYMITSLPVEEEAQTYILEAVVRITDQDLLNELRGKDYFEIKQILKKRNREMVQDPLTGAYNRRFIDERLPFEIVDAMQIGGSSVLVMADIDFFKKVNDTYGHDAGDYVLKTFVEVISDNIRTRTDWIARYGGEEFVLFMKGIDKEKALEKVEEIRQAIEAHDFVYEGSRIPITCSFGMSAATEGDTAESWIRRADQLLYKSKTEGRNRISATA